MPKPTPEMLKTIMESLKSIIGDMETHREKLPDLRKQEEIAQVCVALNVSKTFTSIIELKNQIENFENKIDPQLLKELQIQSSIIDKPVESPEMSLPPPIRKTL
jgi:predicted  nucleic acid-binding Zn-ribbon protein